MSLRILIACGGTGGHLFPGIAVADELGRRGHEVLLLVSQKAIDRTVLAARPDLRAEALPAVGWPGLGFRLPAFCFRLVETATACKKLLREYKPDVVLGMGGFTSAVPLWTGRNAGIPTFLHESNAIPGRVTRLLARRVSKVLLGFKEAADRLPGAATVVTGTPVRAALRILPHAEAAAKLGLDPDPARRTIFVTGGSQGAQGVNRLVTEALPRWSKFHDVWQFVHLTGEGERAEVAAAYARHGFGSHAHVRAFSSEMAACYSLADAVIGRSGASSLTELSHYGLASLLIPFPAAADDHQTANALIYERAGAAILYRQEEKEKRGTNPQPFAETVRNLLTNTERLGEMKRASVALAFPDAAVRVANEVEACLC